MKQPIHRSSNLYLHISIHGLGIFILFFVGIRLWKFMLGFIVTIISIPILLQFIQPYQKERIISFLNPESDPLGQGYQLIQSKIALGSGGATGKGFLQGTQSYLEYLPKKPIKNEPIFDV